MTPAHTETHCDTNPRVHYEKLGTDTNTFTLKSHCHVAVLPRSLWDVGSHDVHNNLPAGSLARARELETQDLGLQLVLSVSEVSSLIRY